jgi:predicted nucleic acid-binding protein
MSLLIVADAGPLIGLARVGRLWLLRDLYSKVLIPPSVHEELQIPLLRPGFETLAQALEESWIAIEAPLPASALENLRRMLDSGEAEAIVLAEQRNIGLLIDEKRGRTIASSRGLQIIGTGAVLLLAKRRGLIDRVSEILDQFSLYEYRISPRLRRQILEEAGEA